MCASPVCEASFSEDVMAGTPECDMSQALVHVTQNMTPMCALTRICDGDFASQPLVIAAPGTTEAREGLGFSPVIAYSSFHPCTAWIKLPPKAAPP